MAGIPSGLGDDRISTRAFFPREPKLQTPENVEAAVSRLTEEINSAAEIALYEPQASHGCRFPRHPRGV